MLQICKNYGIFQFRYIYITIYKDGAVINQQVSKISLYRSSTENRHVPYQQTWFIEITILCKFLWEFGILLY